MLAPNLHTIRLFLHVLSASVWVGGQIVLGGLVPTLRRTFPGSTEVVARAFARIAWPAYAIVVITGLWNLSEIIVGSTSTAYQITLFVKVSLAVASGAAAAAHQLATSKLAMAVGGALGLLFAVGAMFLGQLLSTGA